MATKGYSLTIVWGTNEEETKTYTFKTIEEMEAFQDGVYESNGWWEYKIIDEDEEVA
tara:strand:+ start:7068 stop:7238 length:171 start_codon:yes stop_codon:yes gene_type:complete